MSTTRSRNAIALFAALSASALLLTRLSRGVAEPDLHTPAALAIPVGAELVATLDMTLLRRSSLAGVLGGVVERYAGGRRDEATRICGFDPLAAVSEIALAVPGAPLDGELGVSASGDVSGPALAECAAKVIKARGGRPIVLREGEFFVVSDPSSTGALAARTGGPVLLGGASYVRQMMAAAERRAPSILVDARHLALRHEAGDEAAIVVSALLTADSRERIRRELDGVSAPAASVVGVALSVDTRAGVDVHAVVGCERPEPCAELGRGLSTASDPSGSPLARLLARAQISAVGPTLHARAALSASEALAVAMSLSGG